VSRGGGGQSANGTAEWRTGALTRSLPDASAIESNSERVDFAPEILGRDYRRMQFAGGGIRRSSPSGEDARVFRSLSALTAAQEGQPAAPGAQNIQTPISP
jgi:hypothetical protein